MKKIIFSLISMVAILSASDNFMQMGMVDNLHVMVSSKKVLSEGDNKIKVEVLEGSYSGKVAQTKDVRIKFFMPEMPGMPYMESKDICKNRGDFHECTINFSMSGTWQYLLFVTDKAGKKHTYKNSVNLGGSNVSSTPHNH